MNHFPVHQILLCFHIIFLFVIRVLLTLFFLLFFLLRLFAFLLVFVRKFPFLLLLPLQLLLLIVTERQIQHIFLIFIHRSTSGHSGSRQQLILFVFISISISTAFSLPLLTLHTLRSLGHRIEVLPALFLSQFACNLLILFNLSLHHLTIMCLQLLQLPSNDALLLRHVRDLPLVFGDGVLLIVHHFTRRLVLFLQLLVQIGHCLHLNLIVFNLLLMLLLHLRDAIVFQFEFVGLYFELRLQFIELALLFLHLLLVLVLLFIELQLTVGILKLFVLNLREQLFDLYLQFLVLAADRHIALFLLIHCVFQSHHGILSLMQLIRDLFHFVLTLVQFMLHRLLRLPILLDLQFQRLDVLG
mmetsp:Transcript_45289/g.72381  ORF Transcript_45289/g.72381 Transcript_45289/m.72381 type:complete len:357 (+) Transcript_45289:675-1745(+)